jgi:hypothetical protein
MKITASSLWTDGDVRAELACLVGAVPRRAGRFAELALLGAAQCAAGMTLPADSAVLLASRRGSSSAVRALVQAVAIEGAAPMPFTFIASQGNTACQLVARQFALSGAALCLSSDAACFERTLLLALSMLPQCGAPMALAGWVEEEWVGETAALSHWLCLDLRPQASGAQVEALIETDEAGARRLISAAAANDVLDLDHASAALLTWYGAVAEESAMAHHLRDWLATGSGRYLRIRAGGGQHYIVLALTRQPGRGSPSPSPRSS